MTWHLWRSQLNQDSQPIHESWIFQVGLFCHHCSSIWLPSIKKRRNDSTVHMLNTGFFSKRASQTKRKWCSQHKHIATLILVYTWNDSLLTLARYDTLSNLVMLWSGLDGYNNIRKSTTDTRPNVSDEYMNVLIVIYYDYWHGA